MDDAKRAESRVELAALRQELEDRAGMALALTLAEEAERADEVPIGAVVVRDGVLLGAARNECAAAARAPRTPS